MRANELMTGDWVCYDGDTDYSCPIKIEGMDISCGFCITSDRDDAGFDGVIPIPLTAEILENNGFTEEIDSWWTIDNPRYKSMNIVAYHGVDDDVPNAFLGHWAFDENYAIDYVHELQHALRLCGLNELADNFII